MYPKMLARTIAPMAAMARRTVVDNRGRIEPALGGGTEGDSINGGGPSECMLRHLERREHETAALRGSCGMPMVATPSPSISSQALTGFPHSGQNFMFPGTSCPSGHLSVCGAPHSPQNLSPG